MTLLYPVTDLMCQAATQAFCFAYYLISTLGKLLASFCFSNVFDLAQPPGSRPQPFLLLSLLLSRHGK